MFTKTRLDNNAIVTSSIRALKMAHSYKFGAQRRVPQQRNMDRNVIRSLQNNSLETRRRRHQTIIPITHGLPSFIPLLHHRPSLLGTFGMDSSPLTPFSVSHTNSPRSSARFTTSVPKEIFWEDGPISNSGPRKCQRKGEVFRVFRARRRRVWT